MNRDSVRVERESKTTLVKEKNEPAVEESTAGCSQPSSQLDDYELVAVLSRSAYVCLT